MSNNASTNLLIHAMNIGALELISEGRKLKSGRLSPYFFNSGLFNTGESLDILATAYAKAIYVKYPDVDIIFGPAYKGIPLAATIAMKLGGEIAYSCNRKEEKTHGDGGTIMGASLKGKKVIIVDDVMTTGASIKEALDIIKLQGGIVEGVVIGFDRQEKGVNNDFSAVKEFEKGHNIHVSSATSLSDLIEYLKNKNEYNNILQLILKYRDNYGSI